MWIILKNELSNNRGIIALLYPAMVAAISVFELSSASIIRRSQ